MFRMLDEIREEGRTIRDTLKSSHAPAKEIAQKLKNSDYVIITGSGTSFHAGMPLQISLLRKEIPALMVKAPDFSSYLPQHMSRNVSVLILSQSGESADALNALDRAASAGAWTAGITNESESQLSSKVNIPIITAAGHEDAVAATKSYIAQLTAVSMIESYILEFKAEATLEEIAHWYDESLRNFESFEKKAETIKDKIAILANSYLYSSASEAALKFRETGNLVTDAYPAREYLHGPIQTLDKNTTVIMLDDGNTDFTNVRSEVSKYTDSIFSIGPGEEYDVTVPKVREEFMPLVFALPIQLLSYYKSVGLGLNPDNPGKLTKVVR